MSMGAGVNPADRDQRPSFCNLIAAAPFPDREPHALSEGEPHGEAV